MTTTLTITDQPIDEARLLAARRIPADCGAAVTFLGVVRDIEAGAKIAALDYEAQRAMAEHQFRRIFAEVERRWPVSQLDLVHRIGRIPVGEASLWIQIVAGHRREAFEACQFVIDELKKVVPIWKLTPSGTPRPSEP
ncbi:MAG: molybdenum cofactor biosynthesis protein MoaE [Verrucomicrobia bacterium]|nr:molybdenum cofactor biosynthesis protein MoaE [Verrucomicrobiota bacterium]